MKNIIKYLKMRFFCKHDFESVQNHHIIFIGNVKNVALKKV